MDQTATQTIDEPEVDDEPIFDTDMEAADKEDELLLAVPTGDAEDPIAIEKGWWDVEEQHWTGPWRDEMNEDGTPTLFAQMDPIGWCELPDIDDSLYALIGATPPEARGA